jgi:hypothetical protein
MWLRASGTWARYLKTDAVPCSREPLSCFSRPLDRADATGWDETRPVASDPGGSSSETSPPSSSLMPSVALAGHCYALAGQRTEWTRRTRPTEGKHARSCSLGCTPRPARTSANRTALFKRKLAKGSGRGPTRRWANAKTASCPRANRNNLWDIGALAQTGRASLLSLANVLLWRVKA